MSEDIATCANHPHRRVRAFCTGCGKPLCRHCLSRRRRQPWCRDCLHSRLGDRHLPYPTALSAAQRPAPMTGEPDTAIAGRTGADPVAAEARVPDPARPSHRLGLPPLLYGVLAIQLVATLLAAYAAWRAAAATHSVPVRAALRLPATAQTSAPASRPLSTPSLDLRPEAELRGAPVSLRGTAPDAEVVALLVDGELNAVALVVEGRFLFDGVDLPDGEHRLSVVAWRRSGAGVESPPWSIHYLGLEEREVRPPTAPSARAGSDRGQSPSDRR